MERKRKPVARIKNYKSKGKFDKYKMLYYNTYCPQG